MGRSLLLYPWNKMLSPYCQDLSESGIFCCYVYPQGTTSLNCSSVSSCLIWSLLESVSQCSLALSAFFQLCYNASLSPYFPSPPVVTDVAHSRCFLGWWWGMGNKGYCLLSWFSLSLIYALGPWVRGMPSGPPPCPPNIQLMTFIFWKCWAFIYLFFCLSL